MLQLHIIVTGKVQGVGYRYFTHMKAVRYGITGWVKNRQDGAVEMVANGTKASLDDFIQDINNGNPFSTVKEMEITELTSGERYQSFTIKY